MKKFLAFLMAALMVFSMVACSAKKEEEAPPKSELTPVTTEATTGEEAPATEPATEPVTEPVTTEPAETKDMVSLGQMNGGVYTNTYAGFQCTLGSDWTFMSAEQLQELPGLAAEMLEGSAFDADDIALSMIADMMAENVTTMCTMNVQYQKTDAAMRAVYLSMNEEQLLKTMLAEVKDSMVATYAQSGITVSSMEAKAVTFLGEQHYALYTVADESGVPYYVLQMFDYSKGSYGIILTLGSFVEDNTASMLGLFTKA